MNAPRLMSKADAAAYCGLSPAGYDAWQKAGKVPGPLPGTHRYDRKAIDDALDRQSGLATLKQDTPFSAYDEWKRGRDAHKATGHRVGDQAAR